MATSELFEAILLQLDMRDLLLSAVRVCKAWGDAIDTSPANRQALFFDPIPASRRPLVQDLVLNPLLVKQLRRASSNSAPWPSGDGSASYLWYNPKGEDVLLGDPMLRGCGLILRKLLEALVGHPCLTWILYSRMPYHIQSLTQSHQVTYRSTVF
ncbi:Nucleotide-binding, alpha-beta plait [Purpureocillium lavendulum]|uniref:Nucleotide-binding, alpha-beta plait n=1 Tax=Purpureocillium lavendulum TaxID=1247861 RepID=A0AB34FTP9_9HYPO|nr:Nucleotide-binding, alpha-beta plait [Purpureocillium lavendulum]